MDLESAAPTSSRRQLLGALGAAGIASAAAVAIARPAAAAPVSPSDADKEILRPVMEVELTARDLYLAASEAGMSEEATTIASEFAKNHAAYADAIAGACGFSATGHNDDLFDEHVGDFEGTDDTAFATAATALENSLVGTHTELFPEYESVQAREMTVSIITVEARMATVLVEFAGDAGNLDALLDPPTDALTLEGAQA